MTPREFRAYCRFHEMSEERLDRRTAQLCLIFATGHLTRKDGQPFTFADFLPQSKQTTYNGHSDPAADLREFRATLTGLRNARRLPADDPRLYVDAEEVARYKGVICG